MSSNECVSALSTHLFWDTDRNKFDMNAYPAYIIQRVLEYGTLEDWHLIRSYYGLEQIVRICQSLRTLDAKVLAFISGISNTPKEQYRCYHTKQSNPILWNC